MPRIKIAGDPQNTRRALNRMGVNKTHIADAPGVGVYRIDREDLGSLRRAGFVFEEVPPQRYQAAVLDEAQATIACIGIRHTTLQVAIADATQYAVRRCAQGAGIPTGHVLAVVCCYDLDDADEEFTLAARYTPAEGGWVEVL